MKEKTIYALGFFDGVHIGHAALLKACRELAAEARCRFGVITFGVHPDALVLGKAPRLINTQADRERLLREGFGAETVVTLPFDEKMHSCPWRDFLDMLRRDYGAVGFVCGEDFRFGYRGQGTAGSLGDYCKARHLPWAVVPEQIKEGIRVSSTAIRQELEEGHMEKAVSLLGHPYLLTGQVVHGKQLGRTLGIPTANILLPPELVTPRFGVYAGLAEVEGKTYSAVTNIGVRPTVHGTGITVEPWILDYTGDLYDRTISLHLTHFLRPERKFDSLEALKAEIERNAEQTRKLTAKPP